MALKYSDEELKIAIESLYNHRSSAFVTAWDSHGYPLVNFNTTDRYHVTWDLGWGDKNIFFHLIHLK